MAAEFTVIIPARFGSKRLPGKPLRDVDGKPLIQRTYEAVQTSQAQRIAVATDDEGIVRAVRDFGGEVCLTGATHLSGTDRVAEAAAALGLASDHIVVNVQGDEPDMPGILVDQVAQLLIEDQEASVATACCSLDNREQYHDPSVVKVVADQSGYAIYFSRSPIPHYQPTGESGSEVVPWSQFRRHIGIYAYRLAYLSVFTSRPSCPPEKLEKLEQLRVLWHGDKIAVCEAQAAPGPGVDTVEDLERAILQFQGQG